jgi:hypothetical protein
MRSMASNLTFINSNFRVSGRKSRPCRPQWLIVIACACTLFPPRTFGQAPPTQNRNTAVRAQMRNVDYHFAGSVAVHIANLDGALVPTGEHEMPIFDEKNSFRLQINSAQISLAADSLARVLNSYVFARHDAPLKDISIRIDKSKLKIKGKLHDKGDLPFEMEGQLTPTPDGKIRVHAEHIKALHLPVKGLMDLFGLKIADLIKTEKVRGVAVDKDDVILDPAQVLPPPHIEGRLTAIRLVGNSIVQSFGDSAPRERLFNGPNYMAYSGNRLRFGKLTMDPTDLIMIDMDPKDPFDFYLDHYVEQLGAGYTKTTPQFGLRVYVRDYNKLRSSENLR